MKDKRTSGSWRTAWECILASLALAVLTFVSFRLHAGPAMAALLFFFLVVLISLWAGFLSTAFACTVAALCFVYFFTQPLYHLWMSEPVEIAATIAFSGTALIISRLISRIRERTAEVQQTNEQLQAEIAERKRAEESLHRLNRELRALSECNQILMRATDEPALLREICRIVCEEVGYRVAWVGYAEHNEAKSVRPVAWTGTEEGDVANLGITWADTERGRGIIGTAIRSGKTMCIKDYATNPEVAPWRDSALQHGFRSAIALPLKDEHANIFGSLNIYSAQPNAFASEEIRLLEELAGDLAFGIITLRSRAARERAELALRQSEAYLAESQRLTHTGSWALDLASDKYVYVSEEDFRLWGFDPQEGLPSREAVFRRIHPQDRDKMRARFEKSLREKVDCSDEYRIVLPDGTVKDVHTIRHPVLKGTGDVVKLVGTTLDITERKCAEEALRAQADLLNLTHDTVFVMDMEGVIKYWNRGAEERYGWTAEHALGRVVHDLLKTVFAGPLEEIRAEVSRTGRWEGEILHTKKDGTQVVVASRWALQRDERGAPMAILETNNDITLRKRAEEGLRLSNAYNRSLIEASPDPLVTIGPDGEITDVNAATEAATGRSRGELVGTDFSDYFTEPSKARAGYEQVFREGMVRDYPLELRHRDGGVMSVLYNASVYRDESGRVTGVFAAARDITERQRAEEALRESETRFRTFVDHAADALFIYDFEQGTIVDVSRQACESLGYTRQELIGTMGLAFDRDVDRAVTESMAERMAAGETVIDTHLHQRKDGTLFPVEAHTSQYRYGSRRFLLKVARDISDRLQAEEERAYLASIVESSDDAIIGRSMEGIIQSWNRGAERLYGYTAQEAIGQPITMVIPPDRAQEFVSSDRLKRGEWIEEQETVRVGKDGRRIDMSVIISPMKDAAGRVLGAATIARDITERKRAQEALRRSEAYLAEGQRLSHAGSWAWSPVTRRSLFWSEEMFRIFGLNPQEGVPTTETFWQRIHPDDRDRTYELLLKAALGNMEYEHDHRILLPDGTVKHIHAIGHPVLDDNGQVAEYVGTAVDVTDRKRAEEERERLRQLEADLAHISRVSMMGELAASIAHEVNQPLSGVVVNGNACLRWLAGDSPNLEEAREAVRRIVRDGKRAGDIITRIRALATKTATAKERLDMNEAIREVVAFTGDELRKNRVAVRTEFAPDLSPVLGDRVQLQQVALNLVMNAIEAMSSVEERPRELIVRTQNDDANQVRVTVQDSGVGLDPQGLERIFEAFYTTKQRGMGMGLSISRSIIQNHGGKLWAVANNGPGMSMQFTLPRYQ